MARPNRKTKAAVETTDAALQSIEGVEEGTNTSDDTETTAPKADRKPKAVKTETAPAVKMVSAYSVNTSTDPETAEKRAWGPNTVNGTIIGIVAAIEADGRAATKEAILEAFRQDEKSSKLVATEWTATPMKYIEGYLHFLKGNRSLTSRKIEA